MSEVKCSPDVQNPPNPYEVIAERLIECGVTSQAIEVLMDHSGSKDRVAPSAGIPFEALQIVAKKLAQGTVPNYVTIA